MLRMVTPSLRYRSALLDYKLETARADGDFDGCAGLGNFQKMEMWLERLRLLSPALAEKHGFYPTAVYLALHENQLAGIVNIRLTEDEFLRRYAGHIGYHVRPSMRKRGFAREMLTFAVEICRENGIVHPVICTARENLASQKTALSCGFLPDGEEILETGKQSCGFAYSDPAADSSSAIFCSISRRRARVSSAIFR